MKKLFKKIFGWLKSINKKTTKPSTPPSAMKVFYDTALLENAREASVFDQFAKVQPMTHGKEIEWRPFEPLKKEQDDGNSN